MNCVMVAVCLLPLASARGFVKQGKLLPLDTGGFLSNKVTTGSERDGTSEEGASIELTTKQAQDNATGQFQPLARDEAQALHDTMLPFALTDDPEPEEARDRLRSQCSACTSEKLKRDAAPHSSKPKRLAVMMFGESFRALTGEVGHFKDRRTCQPESLEFQKLVTAEHLILFR
jgi:hypothetical protein